MLFRHVSCIAYVLNAAVQVILILLVNQQNFGTLYPNSSSELLLRTFVVGAIRCALRRCLSGFIHHYHAQRDVLANAIRDKEVCASAVVALVVLIRLILT